MGRLVQPPQLQSVRVTGRGGLEAAGSTVEVAVGGDSFADRVAKYIPGEVIAGYMALDRSLVPSAEAYRETRKSLMEKAARGASGLSEAVGSAGPPAMSPDLKLALRNNLPLVVLIVGLIFTPLYIRQLAKKSGDGTPWATHAVIATLAFFVWAYAIQGSAFTLGPVGQLYDGTYASALVIVFTLVSGLFSPTPSTPTGSAPRDNGRTL